MNSNRGGVVAHVNRYREFRPADRSPEVRRVETHDFALHVLEQAERDTPFCHCGAHTVLVGDGDLGVWLQCADHALAATSAVTSWSDLGAPRWRRLLIDSGGRFQPAPAFVRELGDRR